VLARHQNAAAMAPVVEALLVEDTDARIFEHDLSAKLAEAFQFLRAKFRSLFAQEPLDRQSSLLRPAR